MCWSKRKVPNRKEVNPPINKRFTGSMTGAEELLKREPKPKPPITEEDKKAFKRFLGERDWTEKGPKPYKVFPTTIPIEQRVYAVTESEHLVYASDWAYSKERQLNAHCIVLREPHSDEDAKQFMRDYLTEEFADERILTITLEEE